MATPKKTTRGTSDGMMVSNYVKPKPSVRVDESDLPEIKNWEVGKKYHVQAHVEMRSHSKGDSYGYDGGKEKKHEATLIIHSLKPIDKATPGKNGEKYDQFKNRQGKDKQAL